MLELVYNDLNNMLVQFEEHAQHHHLIHLLKYEQDLRKKVQLLH
jgi:hypothetical protein